MQNLLYRLYRTKLALLATICTATGILLLFATAASDAVWLSRVPVAEVGSALFTTGLIVIAFEYWDSRDAEQRATHQMRRVFTEQVPLLRDAVIEGFATAPHRLAAVASPATLDTVITNALAARLGNTDLATDVYTDLRQQIGDADQFRYDTRVTVSLSPWNDGPVTGFGSMFVATIRWEYRTHTAPQVLRFSSVGDVVQYRQLLRDPASAAVWLFEPSNGKTPAAQRLDARSTHAFRLLQCSINGQLQAIVRTETPTGQTYTVTPNLPGEAADTGRDVHVSYTHAGLISQHGHLLFLDFDKPTKGLQVDFSYGGCGIRHVSMVDFIASATQPRITRSPAGVPAPSIHVGFDGWTFPKSGIAYTWVLEREVQPQQP